MPQQHCCRGKCRISLWLCNLIVSDYQLIHRISQLGMSLVFSETLLGFLVSCSHVTLPGSHLTHWGHHFPDIFKCIFLNENVWISFKISLKLVPKGPINSIPALVQIMAWCRQKTSHYLNQIWLVYWRIYASLGLNELERLCTHYWNLAKIPFALIFILMIK